LREIDNREFLVKEKEILGTFLEDEREETYYPPPLVNGKKININSCKNLLTVIIEIRGNVLQFISRLSYQVLKMQEVF
jgi:hypothetical protein